MIANLSIVAPQAHRLSQPLTARRRRPLIPLHLDVYVVFSAIYTAHLAWVLTQVLPAYFQAATHAPEFGLQGTVLTVQLLLIGTVAWYFGEILSVCRTELRKRLFE